MKMFREYRYGPDHPTVAKAHGRVNDGRRHLEAVFAHRKRNNKKPCVVPTPTQQPVVHRPVYEWKEAFETALSSRIQAIAAMPEVTPPPEPSRNRVDFEKMRRFLATPWAKRKYQTPEPPPVTEKEVDYDKLRDYLDCPPPRRHKKIVVKPKRKIKPKEERPVKKPPPVDKKAGKNVSIRKRITKVYVDAAVERILKS